MVFLNLPEEAIAGICSVMYSAGTNAKKEELKKYKDNEDFRRLLYYILNPMLTYNLSEKSLWDTCHDLRENGTVVWWDGEPLFDLLDMLAGKRSVTEEEIRHIAMFILSQQDKSFFIKLFAKTLNLGVTAKTVNQIIPGLIPIWEVQQAFPIDRYPLKPGTEFWLTEKLNGVRCTYYKGRLYSVKGTPFAGLSHIEDRLKLLLGSRYVADGELTLMNTDDLNSNEALQIATDIISSDAQEKPEIRYTVFDMLLTTEFDGTPKTMYHDRRTVLDRTFADSDNESVQCTPILYHGTDINQINTLFEQTVRNGGKGLLVNRDVPYQRKRHSGVMRVTK